MKLTSRHDIEAPIEFVFDRANDLAAFERAALRRGVQVNRSDPTGRIDVGSTWDATAVYRGKPRRIRARLEEVTPPEGYRIAASSGALDAMTTVDLVALSPRSTRMTVTIELSAHALSARLLLQSMKLARGNLSRRLDARVATFCATVTEAYRSGA